MPLAVGTRLAQYEIIALLGVGGMGEVYRARDTKLGRYVAIKVLPDALVADPERTTRFEREAKVLASLNHPNIAALHGMETAESGIFLAMELVEGETLADRLRRGPLTIQAALGIARQITAALEAAHEQGVIHRDLKPANIKITPDDVVKVLDFGLAKAMDPAAGTDADAARADSPTLSMMATQAGIILGTAAYMSPEQAKGARADRRSDVFSFGVVLYEMLTRRQPFQGETAPEIMASVMVRDPDLSALPADTPERLKSVIVRCLEKQPKKRWQAIGDLGVELEAIANAPQGITPLPATTATPWWRRAIAAAALIMLGAVVTGSVMWRQLRPVAPAVVRFQMGLAEGLRFAPTNRRVLAWSSDGQRLAFVVADASGRSSLMTRRLGDSEAQSIGGTTLGATNNVFFSPDGQWIGFWSAEARALKKVPVTGGAAITICTAGNIMGAHWVGNAIVFADTQAIMRVPADGGEPEVLVKLDPAETASSPFLLPDLRTLIFAVTSDRTETNFENGTIVAQTIGGTDRRVLVRNGNSPQYIATGHLLYGQGGAMMAVPFDGKTATVTGAPATALEGARRTAFAPGPDVAVSESGTLAYIPGLATGTGPQTLAVMDVNGVTETISTPGTNLRSPRVSPDGRQIAVTAGDGKSADVWIHQVAGTGVPRRLTFGGRNEFPVWTRDGQTVVFQSDREGDLGLFEQRADGTGRATRVTTGKPNEQHVPWSTTPAGTLAFVVAQSGSGPGSSPAVWTVALTGDRVPRPLLAAAGVQFQSPAFSPDGRWIAYSSNDPGRNGYNTYVQPIPPTGATFQLTTEISFAPVWTANGQQVWTAYREQLFNRSVQTQPFVPGPARRIPSDGILGTESLQRNFDVMPDGRVLVILPESMIALESRRRLAPRVNVVVNWFEELKAKLP
jgi:Tol biopolymer transport system component